MKRVVTLGEMLLRLSPENYQKIEQTRNFSTHYGGAEANVAVGLANLGIPVSYVTKLPNHALGWSAKHYLNQFGVNTDHILYGGERLGLYYLEQGYSIRPSKVIYDRKHSSFSQSKREEYDFEDLFKDADWFHITGITPALSDELFEISKEALIKAKSLGLKTSCDLNYRSALWTFQTARKKMTELLPYVDVCIGIEPLILLNEEGIDIKDEFQEPRSHEDVMRIMKEMEKQFGFTEIAVTFRDHLSVSHNKLSAMLYDGKHFYQSKEFDVEFIDRVGGGDAFAVGLIYGLFNDHEMQEVINFATATFALKHTIVGDACLFYKDEIDRLLNQEVKTIDR